MIEWTGPWSFTYLSDIGKQRIHVEIKEHIVQYFTNDSLFKVRLQFEDGNIIEGLYTKMTVLNWLEKRVPDPPLMGGKRN